MLLTCSSSVNLGKFSEEFQDPSAAHLIFVAVAAPGTKQHHCMLIRLCFL